jgi:hypothetical protein
MFFCAICVILACDVIEIDLQMLKIWDFRFMLKSRQAKPSQAMPTAWEAHKGIPSQRRPQESMMD